MKQIYTWVMTNKAVVGLVTSGVLLLAQKCGIPLAGVTVDQSGYFDALTIFLLAHHDQLVKAKA